MKTSRRKVEELTWVLGLHGSAVKIHRKLGKREDVRALKRFYAGLFPTGNLVFEIGANVGLYSDALEAISARVIPVEPNSDCVRHSELTYRGRAIEAVHAAVGPENGLEALHLSDDHDDSSTILDQKLNNGQLSNA